jgi:hypothetical protein
MFWLNYRSGELVNTNGVWVLVPLTLPILIASLPVLFPSRATHGVAAILLVIYAYLSGMSIGAAYWPSAVVMLIAFAFHPADVRGHRAV